MRLRQHTACGEPEGMAAVGLHMRLHRAQPSCAGHSKPAVNGPTI